MAGIDAFNQHLLDVNNAIYDKLSFDISHLNSELEGSAYDACQFELNGKKIISRSSKITPKKAGQFVTFWKRNQNGFTEPFSENDQFDFYVINVKAGERFGQFVFPKSELIKKGYIISKSKAGKRGFRVYPIWDEVQNSQAKRTQQWQLGYFYEINKTTDLDKVSKLYQIKQSGCLEIEVSAAADSEPV
ncbi:MepB family protein [Echinicola strongylocentroti]|uniref:MepB family protein n=2 Tax=Echinicola strongylocentroti TaxID=1795355 RepID=A0A2Z4IRU0_9BACT|nr:MepB family protein [Echinicola strongylocentroti]